MHKTSAKYNSRKLLHECVFIGFAGRSVEESKSKEVKNGLGESNNDDNDNDVDSMPPLSKRPRETTPPPPQPPSGLPPSQSFLPQLIPFPPVSSSSSAREKDLIGTPGSLLDLMGRPPFVDLAAAVANKPPRIREKKSPPPPPLLPPQMSSKTNNSSSSSPSPTMSATAMASVQAALAALQAGQMSLNQVKIFTCTHSCSGPIITIPTSSAAFCSVDGPWISESRPVPVPVGRRCRQTALSAELPSLSRPRREPSLVPCGHRVRWRRRRRPPGDTAGTATTAAEHTAAPAKPAALATVGKSVELCWDEHSLYDTAAAAVAVSRGSGNY